MEVPISDPLGMGSWQVLTGWHTLAHADTLWPLGIQSFYGSLLCSHPCWTLGVLKLLAGLSRVLFWQSPQPSLAFVSVA